MIATFIFYFWQYSNVHMNDVQQMCQCVLICVCMHNVFSHYVQLQFPDTTVEPCYNEDLGTMKITLLYQVSHYIRVKKKKYIKSWDQQNHLVIRGFCYIRPLYNEVPVYKIIKEIYMTYWFLLFYSHPRASLWNAHHKGRWQWRVCCI